MKTIKSYNKNTNKDCFGITASETRDHIWPTSKDGAKAIENIQLLTQKGNVGKANETKGEVNGVRFSITPAGEDGDGKTIGQMKIKVGNEWLKVIPVR